MKTIEVLIDELQELSVPRGNIIYEILLRNAGWGVKWFETSRCKTPLPVRTHSRSPSVTETVENLRRHTEAVAARTSEGSIVYGYHPTLREALEAELERVLALAPPSANGHGAPSSN